VHYSESLENYELLIKNIRGLKARIYQRYQMLESSDTSPDARKLLINENQRDEIELSDLKNVTAFKPRTFNVYLSAVEIAIKKFIDENPEPEQYERCLHLHGTELKRIYHADTSLHMVNQCKACGGIESHAKKNPEIDLDLIPLYDPSALEKWIFDNSAHSRWSLKKGEVAREARFAGGDMPPEFDYNQFVELYIQDHPEPFNSQVCAHSRSEAKYRKYETSDCVALQCLDCGKHLKALKKSNFPQYEKLPIFDEAKEKDLNRSHNQWLRAKYDAYENARKSFSKDAQLRILVGEIEISDNSKFATYYDSIEWSKTRDRIFQRDNFKCRNSQCHNNSECVHHIVYERFGEEHDFDLISLCHECHQKVHFIQYYIPYWYKLTPSEIDNLVSTYTMLHTHEDTSLFFELASREPPIKA
jgi:hypothetical protein